MLTFWSLAATKRKMNVLTHGHPYCLLPPGGWDWKPGFDTGEVILISLLHSLWVEECHWLTYTPLFPYWFYLRASNHMQHSYNILPSPFKLLWWQGLPVPSDLTSEVIMTKVHPTPATCCMSSIPSLSIWQLHSKNMPTVPHERKMVTQS